MTRPLLIALGLLGLLATVAADLPETYAVIVTRDVFNAKREPAVSRSARLEPVAPVAPPDSLTLLGVAILDGRATALFAGSAPEFTGLRRPGETLGAGRVVTIDTDGVTFETDPVSTLRVRVGQTLARSAGQAWQLSTSAPAPVAGPSGTMAPTAAAGTTPAPGPAAATSPADMLKQMLERRQRELTP